MNARLKQFLSAENISQSQFADNIKVVRASVSHILSGRNNPSYEFIKALMNAYPSLNIEWLILGKGKMYKGENSMDATLFNDEQEYEILKETESPAPAEIPVTPIVRTDISDDIPKLIKSQRNISKVMIFFDDGTYKEV